MPVMRVVYITLLAATIAVRVVILIRNIQIYRRDGEEGLHIEGKRAAIDRMKRQTHGAY